MNTDSASKGRMGDPDAQPPTSHGRNFFQRIILFIISVPAIFVLVSLAPEKGHWPLNITLILISIPCAFEASRLFAMNPHKTAHRTFGIVVNSIAYPVVSFLWVLNVIETRLLLPAYMALVMSVMFVQVFNQQHTLHKISRNIGKHLAIIAYPSLFIAHLIMISKIPGASQLYIVLLLGVILNDTMAFLSGKLYKRYHTYPTALSPNKTTAGFIVGFIFSPIGFLIGYYMFPELFPGGVPVVLILGLMVGFTTISGDLIESGLKRSARRKDSGEVILGRGGMLDSLDSILYSAPIVFYVYQLTNGIWVI